MEGRIKRARGYLVGELDELDVVRAICLIQLYDEGRGFGGTPADCSDAEALLEKKFND